MNHESTIGSMNQEFQSQRHQFEKYHETHAVEINRKESD